MQAVGAAPFATDTVVKEDNNNKLLSLIESAKNCRDEKAVASLREKVIIELTVRPIEKIEQAAVPLIGRKYTFKEGVTGYFRDEELVCMRARSAFLRKRLEKGDLNFPHLSKESFIAVVEDLNGQCAKHKAPSLKTRVEIYKTFGNSLKWFNLTEDFHAYSPVDLEGAILCFQLLKDDPRVMERIKFRLRFEPNLVLELYKHIPDLNLPLVLREDTKTLIVQAESVKSVELDRVENPANWLKDKREVVLSGCYSWNADSFIKNNPKVEKLTLIGCSKIIGYITPSITSLELLNCTIREEDCIELSKLELVYLKLSYVKLDVSKRKMREIVSRLESFALEWDDHELLRLPFPNLARLELSSFKGSFYFEAQPSVTFLRWSIYSGHDFLLSRFLPQFPNLHTLDISLGREVVNYVVNETFDVLKEFQVKCLILRDRRWHSCPLTCGPVPSLIEIDISLGGFFENDYLRRMKNLCDICPNLKRVVYSGHERYNFPCEIENLKEAFKQIEFIER